MISQPKIEEIAIGRVSDDLMIPGSIILQKLSAPRMMSTSRGTKYCGSASFNVDRCGQFCFLAENDGRIDVSLSSVWALIPGSIYNLTVKSAAGARRMAVAVASSVETSVIFSVVCNEIAEKSDDE
ncbi:hypothetical protein PV328_004115 [Microctonus aethiopoides]|uniref:Uncharacterized protein n=1 Tax=Microctonus aethiopoides TaxID=144406 RepID=A0AA39F9Y5_9HYME|nr:hypothetical protein PV328_004115 [Microctonus aethiopoides]